MRIVLTVRIFEHRCRRGTEAFSGLHIEVCVFDTEPDAAIIRASVKVRLPLTGPAYGNEHAVSVLRQVKKREGFKCASAESTMRFRLLPLPEPHVPREQIILLHVRTKRSHDSERLRFPRILAVFTRHGRIRFERDNDIAVVQFGYLAARSVRRVRPVVYPVRNAVLFVVFRFAIDLQPVGKNHAVSVGGRQYLLFQFFERYAVVFE